MCVFGRGVESGHVFLLSFLRVLEKHHSNRKMIASVQVFQGGDTSIVHLEDDGGCLLEVLSSSILAKLHLIGKFLQLPLGLSSGQGCQTGGGVGLSGTSLTSLV